MLCSDIKHKNRLDFTKSFHAGNISNETEALKLFFVDADRGYDENWIKSNMWYHPNDPDERIMIYWPNNDGVLINHIHEIMTDNKNLFDNKYKERIYFGRNDVAKSQRYFQKYCKRNEQDLLDENIGFR